MYMRSHCIVLYCSSHPVEVTNHLRKMFPAITEVKLIHKEDLDLLNHLR